MYMQIVRNDALRKGENDDAEGWRKMKTLRRKERREPRPIWRSKSLFRGVIANLAVCVRALWMRRARTPVLLQLVSERSARLFMRSCRLTDLHQSPNRHRYFPSSLPSLHPSFFPCFSLQAFALEFP